MNSRLLRNTAAAAIMVSAILGTAGSASAFEPPADPRNRFSCEGGPVAGHPGHRGLSRAMTQAASPTAWNAADNAGPVTTCG